MKSTLTSQGQPVLPVVSCLGDGDTGGSLLYLDGEDLHILDEVSTTGLHSADGELVRMLWAPSQVAGGTSIIHYTEAGVHRVVSIAGLTDPHDVLWDGHHYIAVSSYQDCILWITPDGEVSKCLRLAGGADCWHVNSLVMHDGALYATAFGRFEESRGWVGTRLEGTGMLFRVDTGEDALTGLCCPHTPRFVDDQWIVCSSATSELLAFSADGRRLWSVQLQDWVRGLAVADEHILVGESVNRQLTGDVRGGSIAVLDRRTRRLLDRIVTPYREVYDIVLAAPALVSALVQAETPAALGLCPPQLPRHL